MNHHLQIRDLKRTAEFGSLSDRTLTEDQDEDTEDTESESTLGVSSPTILLVRLGLQETHHTKQSSPPPSGPPSQQSHSDLDSQVG